MKWNPTAGGYDKVCPVCGRAFTGRLNKVYCDDPCKSKHNNGLAAERRIRLMEISSGVLQNIELLSRELDGQASKWTTINKLKSSGFDVTAPSQHIQTSGERKGYKYGEYVIIEYPEKDQILLTKSK